MAGFEKLTQERGGGPFEVERREAERRHSVALEGCGCHVLGQVQLVPDTSLDGPDVIPAGRLPHASPSSDTSMSERRTKASLTLPMNLE